MQKWAENSENFGSVPDALADIRDRMHYVALLNVHQCRRRARVGPATAIYRSRPEVKAQNVVWPKNAI